MKKVLVVFLALVMCMGMLSFAVSAEEKTQSITAENRGRGENELIVYTPAFGATTATNQWGAEAVVDGDNKIIRVTTNGDEAIPEGGFVVSGHSDMKTWILNNCKVGMYCYYDARSATILLSTEPSQFGGMYYTIERTVTGYNGVRGEQALIIYDQSGTTGTNEWGYEALVDASGRIIQVGGNNNSVPKGGFVISGQTENIADSTGNDPTQMAGVTVATGDIVKVIEHVVQIAALGMDIHMVHIALSAVEEDALGAGDGLFQISAGEAGPVGGDLAATNSIRMVAEVHQNQCVRTLAVEPDNIDPLVHIADRTNDVGIVNTGVGLDTSVLHAIAADESNVGSLTDAEAHAGGLQVSKCHLDSIRGLVDQGLLVFELQRIGGVSQHGGTGVGMGGVEKDCLPGKTGNGSDIVTDGVGNIGSDTAVVNGHQGNLVIAAGKSQTVNFQFIQNAFCITGFEVAGNGDAQHRGNIYSGKTSL